MTDKFSKKKRSDFHLRVWEKSEEEKTFECFILFRGPREICEKIEKTLILLWGKKIDGGVLCNFADGGEGGNTWFGPGAESRRKRISEISREMWKRPEYRDAHSKGMKNSQKVKKHLSSLRTNPDFRENHRKSVQKKGKYSQEELDSKYGSDKKGSKWYYNTEEDRTKMFQSDPGKPWIQGRKKPTA